VRPTLLVLAATLVVPLAAARAESKSKAKPTAPAADTEQPAACTLTPVAPFDLLIAKASKSTIRALPSTPECSKALLAHATVAATSDKVRLLASVTAGSGLELELAFANVDIASSDHGYDWTLTSIEGPALGAVSIHLPVVAVETRSLVISFIASQDDRRQIERPATELIAAARNADAWTPRRDAEDRSTDGRPPSVVAPPITNVAVIDLPPRLASPAGYKWRVTSSTWGQSIAFLCHGAHGLELTKLTDVNAPPCELTPDRIMFAVRRRMKSELVVRLELGDGGSAAKIVLTLPLAREARVESLPVPLWRVARVQCRYHPLIGSDFSRDVRSSGTLGIEHNAITDGDCYVTVDFSFVPVFDPIADTDAARAAAAERKNASCARWKELVELSGPQNVEMTVTRGTATTTKEFQFLPASSACAQPVALPDGVTHGAASSSSFDIPVPAPKGSEQQEGSYVVTLRLKGSPEVHYFERTLDEAAIENNVDAGASFTLRPRGPLSTNWPVRYGASLIAIPVGLRFPARARDVASSTSPSNVHLEGPRTAVMLSLELWNHDHNQDPLPVPIQAQFGMTLFRAAEKPVDLTVLAGFNFVLPFAATGRSENELSIGLFWERELMATHSHALLLTANINLFEVKSSGQ
jgi:hypothetical protein